MALTPQGSASAAATSVAIPTHAVGDLIVIFAYRDGSATAPSKPAAGGTVPAWNDINSGAGANTNASRSAYFVATATNHTTGTWTNATGIAAIVLRGQAATPIGASDLSGGTANGTGTTPTITPQVANGTSFQLHCYGHRTVTAWDAAPAGFTRRTTVNAELAINTKDNTTTGTGGTQTFTSTNSGGRQETIEILARDTAPTRTISGAPTTSDAVTRTISAPRSLSDSPSTSDNVKQYVTTAGLSRVGPLLTTSVTANAGTGFFAWTNPNNIKLDDGSTAFAKNTNAGGLEPSDDLDCKGFDFSAIPTNAAIVGVKVEVERHYVGSAVGDALVCLLKAGVQTGDNKIGINDWSSSPRVDTFGGPSDLWGLSLSVADIKDPDFGFCISPGVFGLLGGDGGSEAHIDYVRMTVYFYAVGRSLADAPSTSDSVARILSAPRTLADAPSTSDAVTRSVSGALAVQLVASANITASGEDTTAQLTAPSGKTTGDFGGGRIQDDENPGDAVDLGADEYREDEWCIQFTGDAVDTDQYEFRAVLSDGTPLDTYTVTPTLTVGVAGTSATIADTPSTSDAVIRATAAARSTADTLSTVDTATRVIGGARSAADSPSTADAVTRAASLHKTAADTPSTADVFTRAGVFNRTFIDGPLTADAVTRAGTLVRTLADIPSTLDAVEAIKSINKTLTDAPSTSDALTRTGTFNRTLSDTPTSVDAVTQTATHPRTIADSPSTLDAVVRALTATRTISNATSTSDAVTRAITASRTISSTPSTADIATRIFSGSRTLSDALSTSDAVTQSIENAASLFRTIADNPQTNDSVIRGLAGIRNIGGSPSTLDSFSRIVYAPRNISDSASTVDSVNRDVALPRFAADSINTIDSVSRSQTINRTIGDFSNVADLLSRNITASRSFGDSVTTNDFAFANKQTFFNISDFPSTSDSIFIILDGLHPVVTFIVESYAVYLIRNDIYDAEINRHADESIEIIRRSYYEVRL